MKLKFLFPVVLLIIAASLISSCKKKVFDPNEDVSVLKSAGDQYFTLWNGLDAHRKLSPYSLKVINVVKSAMARSTDSVIRKAGSTINRPSGLQLYYAITPTTESEQKQMNAWHEADSTHQLAGFPLDSVSLHPLAYEGKLDSLQAFASTFYTTVPTGNPLPSGMGATILDTLYVPDSTECVVDYFAHLVTGNFSPLLLREINQRSPTVFRNIESYYGNNPILEDLATASTIPWEPDWDGKLLLPDWWRRDDVIVGGGNGTSGIPDGRVTVTDCNNVMEGVRNVKIHVVHFTFLFGVSIHCYSTGNDGHFDIGWYPPGPFQIMVEYKNSKIKLKMADVTTGWNAIGSVLNASTAAKDVRGFWGQPGEKNIDHAFNSRFGLCDVIWNGITEANQYTIDLGMRSNNSQTPHLTILAYYRSNRGTPGSAPMLSNINYVQSGVAWLYGQMGLSEPAPTSVMNDITDMVISQAKNNPYTCNELRQTIYHEYGHTLHYFKTNNAYWINNIFNSTTSGTGYGDDIDTNPGRFFALSEGWADYVGHTFSFMKYGNNVEAEETNFWIVDDPNTDIDESAFTGNYQQLLEQVPTFFNDFIPRGLFYDLTDGVNPDENAFDNIQGFTINQIYQKLNPNMTRIQQFRTKWDTDHPNTNNAALFNQYGVQ